MSNPSLTLRAGQLVELPYSLDIENASERLFTEFGIVFSISDDHPFVVAERARWRDAIARGDLWFAWVDELPVGFSVLGLRDGRAYLEQLAVRPEYGRRGIGRALVEKACDVSRARGETELWLTTYSHVPWNAPLYEKLRFSRVSEAVCPAEIRVTLAEQRSVLPFPEQRVAMRRYL
jgi:ribosomal protein S18 acetylase RimI-like enzyme